MANDTRIRSVILEFAARMHEEGFGVPEEIVVSQAAYEDLLPNSGIFVDAPIDVLVKQRRAIHLETGHGVVSVCPLTSSTPTGSVDSDAHVSNLDPCTPKEALDRLFNAAVTGIGGVKAAALFNIVSAALNGPQRTKEPEPCPDEDACDRKAVNNEPRLCSNEACSNEPARNAGGHFERCLGCGEFRGEVDEAEPCSNGYGYQGHAFVEVEDDGQTRAPCTDSAFLSLPYFPNDDTQITCIFCRREAPCEYALRVRRGGELSVMGIHADCIEPLRHRNPCPEPAVPSGLERCLQDLAEGGTLVSSKDCSPEEIAFARACERFYVGPNGYGYVLRSRNVALPSSERTETPSYLDALEKRVENAVTMTMHGITVRVVNSTDCNAFERILEKMHADSRSACVQFLRDEANAADTNGYKDCALWFDRAARSIETWTGWAPVTGSGGVT